MGPIWNIWVVTETPEVGNQFCGLAQNIETINKVVCRIILYKILGFWYKSLQHKLERWYQYEYSNAQLTS